MEIIDFISIDSTYSEAGRRAPGFADGDYLFLTRAQTAGRGQGDHSFESPDGSGIYATLLVKRDFGHADTGFSSFVTALAAVSITDVVRNETSFGERLSIKPVNDLMLDCKKYGGILCASDVKEGKTVAVRIGFGINLGDAHLPEVAVSLGLGRAGSPELAETSRRIAVKAAELIAASLRLRRGEENEDGVKAFTREETSVIYNKLCDKYRREKELIG